MKSISSALIVLAGVLLLTFGGGLLPLFITGAVVGAVGLLAWLVTMVRKE